MPADGQPQILQATPSGYLVQFPDGSQQNLTEESAVQLGLVQPTQGLYQQPQVDPANLQQQFPQQNELGTTQGQVPTVPQALGGAAPLQPGMPPQAVPAGAPQAPGAAMGPGGSNSYRTGSSFSQPHYGSRDLPAPNVDRTPVTDAVDMLGQNRDAYAQTLADQEAALHAETTAVTDAQQAKDGIYDPFTGELMVPGQTQKLLQEREAQQARRAEFEQVAAEAVQAKERQITENIMRVPQEDPGNYWTDRSALQNGAGILAAAIGGYLAVSTGSGKNLGLEALERAIGRDVEAQRTNIESQWKKVASSKEELTRLESQLGDKRAWFAEQATYRYETLALRAEAEMGKFASEEKKARLAGAAAALRQKGLESTEKSLQFHAEYVKGIADQVEKTQLQMLELNNPIGQVSGSSSYGESSGPSQGGAPAPVQVGFDQVTQKPIYVPANLYDVHKTKVGERVEEYRAAGDFLRNAQQLKAIYGTLGSGFNTNLKGLGSEMRDRALALRNKLAYEMARQNDPAGRVTEQDLKLAQAQLGDPETWHRRGGSPQLEQAIEVQRQRKQGLINTYGFSDEPSGARSGEPGSFLSSRTDITQSAPVVGSGVDLKPDVAKAATAALTGESARVRGDNLMALIRTLDSSKDPDVEAVIESALGNRKLTSEGLAARQGKTRGGVTVARENVRMAVKEGIQSAEAQGDTDGAEYLRTVGQAMDVYLLNREKGQKGDANITRAKSGYDYLLEPAPVSGMGPGR